MWGDLTYKEADKDCCYFNPQQQLLYAKKCASKLAYYCMHGQTTFTLTKDSNLTSTQVVISPQIQDVKENQTHSGGDVQNATHLQPFPQGEVVVFIPHYFCECNPLTRSDLLFGTQLHSPCTKC